jgi:GT2 family glycosyltransferase
VTPGPGSTLIHPQHALDEVLAVLVLYGQPLVQSITFRSLGADLRGLGGARLDLLVYDNSAAPPADPHPVPPEWRIRYIHDATNPGVSRAYLEGARLATQQRKRWLLFLDQDTWFPHGALASYAAAVRRHSEIGLFAPILRAHGKVISPCTYRMKQGTSPRHIAPGVQELAGRSVLNSGMWISLEHYLATGGHDPRIALDFADHEFIDRYKQRHRQFVVVDAECTHDLSAAATQSTVSRLARFRFYCRGARYASRGAWDGLVTASLVGARAGLLSLRHRDLGFLRVAADTMLEGLRRER